MGRVWRKARFVLNEPGLEETCITSAYIPLARIRLCPRSVLGPVLAGQLLPTAGHCGGKAQTLGWQLAALCHRHTGEIRHLFKPQEASFPLHSLLLFYLTFVKGKL